MASGKCDGFSWSHSQENGSLLPLSIIYPLLNNCWLVHFPYISWKSFLLLLNQCNTMPRRSRKMFFKVTVFYLRMSSLKSGAINWQVAFYCEAEDFLFLGLFLKFECLWFCSLVSTGSVISHVYFFYSAHSHAYSTCPAPMDIWVCDSGFKLLLSQLFLLKIIFIWSPLSPTHTHTLLHFWHYDVCGD